MSLPGGAGAAAMGHHHDQARMFTSSISVLDSHVNSDIIRV